MDREGRPDIYKDYERDEGAMIETDYRRKVE